MTLACDCQRVSECWLARRVACDQCVHRGINCVKPQLNALRCTWIMLRGARVACIRRGVASRSIANFKTEVTLVLLLRMRPSAPLRVAAVKIKARISQESCATQLTCRCVLRRYLFV